MKKLISIILLIQIIWLSQNEAFAELYSTPAGWNASTDWEVFEVEGEFVATHQFSTTYTGTLLGNRGLSAMTSEGATVAGATLTVQLYGVLLTEPDRVGRVTQIHIGTMLPGDGSASLIYSISGTYLDDGTRFNWYDRVDFDAGVPGAPSTAWRGDGVGLLEPSELTWQPAESYNYAPRFEGTTNTEVRSPLGAHHYIAAHTLTFTYDIETDDAVPMETLLPSVSGLREIPLNYGTFGGEGTAILELLNGTWPQVTNDKYTTIGVHDVVVRATDWDRDSTTLPVTLTLRTSKSPALTIQYGTGAVDRSGDEITAAQYNGNGAVNLCGGEDGWTRFALDVSVTTNSIDGEFDTVLTLPSEGETRATNDTASRAGYFVETTADGITATGALLPVDLEGPALSGTVSALMKIDATPPVAKATYSGGFSFKDDSEDTLSGISTDGYPTQILFTAPGAQPPTAADPDWATIDDHGMTTSGNYDVWILATDRAGNQHIDRAFEDQYIGGEVVANDGNTNAVQEEVSNPKDGTGFAGGVKTGDVVRMTGIVLLAIASSGIIVGILRKKNNKIINR